MHVSGEHALSYKQISTQMGRCVNVLCVGRDCAFAPFVICWHSLECPRLSAPLYRRGVEVEETCGGCLGLFVCVCVQATNHVRNERSWRRRTARLPIHRCVCVCCSMCWCVSDNVWCIFALISSTVSVGQRSVPCRDASGG